MDESVKKLSLIHVVAIGTIVYQLTVRCACFYNTAVNMKLLPWLILSNALYDVSAFNGIVRTRFGASLANHHRPSIRLLSSSVNNNGKNNVMKSTVCDFENIPTNGYMPTIDYVSTKNSGRKFRDIMLTDANGQLIQFGDKMSKSKPSIVIFLRHLG